MIPLICPVDRAPLAEHEAHLQCGECGRRYAIRGGVVCTLDRPDDFYEGAYENAVAFVPRSERLWHSWPLWLINSGYVWSVRRHVPPGATVVELGCAGGVRYFGTRYRMVGCDLSLSSLAKASYYERRVQADASACIPLPDDSVDAVVSSYFWEHIAPDTKPRILQECQRVVRPGGKIVFLYDVETQHPLIGRYKRKNRVLYDRLFLEGDGHLGYQSPAENLDTFRAAGFRVVEHVGLEKTWLSSPSVYAKLGQFDGAGRAIFRLGARLLGDKPLFYPYTGLTRIVDVALGPWLPAEWARVDAVVCEKLP